MSDPPLNASYHHLIVYGDAECADTPVIRPARDQVRNFPILIHQLPVIGARCRVDTSLSITLDLAMVNSDCRSYSRVGSWRWLRLQEGMYSKGKGRRTAAGKAARATPENTITLSVSVTRASNPRQLVSICPACSQRERNATNSQAELVVFGNLGLLDFSKGRVILRPRVACYSKHHEESVGYILNFTPRDCNNNIVGFGTTPPILITDERALSHVENRQISKRRRLDPDAASASIGSSGVPSARHHIEPRDGSLAPRPTGLTLKGASFHPLLNHAPSTSNPHGQSNELQLRPASGIFLKAPIARLHLAQTTHESTCYDSAAVSMELLQSHPLTLTITPTSGSMTGGTSVTVLGHNFQRTDKVVFGGRVAKTERWSDSALRCITPPSTILGPVVVSIDCEDNQFGEGASVHRPPLCFEYKDFRENELKDMARSVVSRALAGGDQGQRTPALHLLSQFLAHTDTPLLAPTHPYPANPDAHTFPAAMGLEDQVLGFLKHLDRDGPSTIESPANSFLLTSESRKSLLHLSATLGFDKLVADLLRRGVPLDGRDVNGYTALDFAKFYGMDKCASVLVDAGASVTRDGPMEYDSDGSCDAEDRDQARSAVDAGPDDPSFTHSASFDSDASRTAISGVDCAMERTRTKLSASESAAVGEPMRGHTSYVMSVAFSPDGTRIVSGSWDNTIRLWDVSTGAAIGEPLRGHTHCVNSVAFSPDGEHIASGADDHDVRLWDASTGARIGGPMRGHTSFVMSVAFSPDGTRIASSSYDETMRLWDVSTGAAIGEPMRGHTDWVRTVAFSPDGTRIASGSRDKTICLWDVSTGTAIGEPMRGHTKSVSSIVFSPDGTRIVSGSVDETILLWNVSTGTAIGGTIRGHAYPVCSVAFSTDGTHIASGSCDQTIRLWNVSTGMAIGVPTQGHTDDVNSIAFSPDGKYIVSGSDDKTLRLWDVSYTAAMSKPTYEYILRAQQITYEHDWSIDFDDEEEQEEDGEVVHTATLYVLDNDGTLIHCGAVGAGSSILAARDDACPIWLTEHLATCSIHSSSSSN